MALVQYGQFILRLVDRHKEGGGRLDQRAFAALLACALVRAFDFPVPARPPRRPRETAAGFLRLFIVFVSPHIAGRCHCLPSLLGSQSREAPASDARLCVLSRRQTEARRPARQSDALQLTCQHHGSLLFPPWRKRGARKLNI